MSKITVRGKINFYRILTFISVLSMLLSVLFVPFFRVKWTNREYTIKETLYTDISLSQWLMNGESKIHSESFKELEEFFGEPLGTIKIEEIKKVESELNKGAEKVGPEALIPALCIALLLLIVFFVVILPQKKITQKGDEALQAHGNLNELTPRQKSKYIATKLGVSKAVLSEALIIPVIIAISYFWVALGEHNEKYIFSFTIPVILYVLVALSLLCLIIQQVLANLIIKEAEAHNCFDIQTIKSMPAFAYSQGYAANVAGEPSLTANAEKLLEYKKLLDDGIITQEEFDAKRKQLLDL